MNGQHTRELLSHRNIFLEWFKNFSNISIPVWLDREIIAAAFFDGEENTSFLASLGFFLISSISFCCCFFSSSSDVRLGCIGCSSFALEKLTC